MQHLAAAEDLLSQKEEVQGAQDHRVDYDISVINRNHRNQSLSATIRTGDHLKQPSSKWTDYSDYGDYDDASDYAHYSNERVSAYWSQKYEPDPLPTDTSLQYLSEAGDLLTEKEDKHSEQYHRVDYAISVINRNHRNQSDSQCSQATLRAEQNEGENAFDLNDEHVGKARASPSVPNKKCCPHHPHARWVRFDPSCQAWFDKMGC